MARLFGYGSEQRLAKLRLRFSQALHPGRRDRYWRAFVRQLPVIGACSVFAAVLIVPQVYDARASRTVARTKFASCADARRADAAPIYVGERAYSKWLDADGDGVACEFHWPTMIKAWSERLIPAGAKTISTP